jgi:hypothetical protein
MLDGSQERRRQRAIEQRLGFNRTRCGRLAIVNDRFTDGDTFFANVRRRRSVTWAGNQILDNAVSLVAKGTAESLGARFVRSNPLQACRIVPWHGIVPQDRSAQEDTPIADVRSRVIAGAGNQLPHRILSLAAKRTLESA